MSKSNLKTFPVNSDAKMESIYKEFRELLNNEFGENTFAAHVTVIHSSDLGKIEDADTEVTAYRFSLVPTDILEEDLDTFVGLLYQAISKDTNIGSAVIRRYSEKFAEFIGHVIDGAEDEVN